MNGSNECGGLNGSVTRLPDCFGDIGNRDIEDVACNGCPVDRDCRDKFEFDQFNIVEVPEEAQEED